MIIIHSLFFFALLGFLFCLGEKIIQPSAKIDILTALSNVTSNDTTETQHTICRITSDQLIADAQATVTRVLTGACNANAIENRFNLLEKQLEEVKKLILQINFDNYPVNQNNQVEYNNNNNLSENLVKNEHLKPPRQSEIDKLNGTISQVTISNETLRIFTLFWRVDNIKKKLSEWKTGRSQRSGTFYVKEAGYAMYLKITPRYFPDGTIFVAIGLTRGNLDGQLSWPFSLKLQIEILDHSPEFLRLDRVSRLWDPSTMCSVYFWGRPAVSGEPDKPECVGLSIPREVFHTGSKYFWNNSLYVKLIVYL